MKPLPPASRLISLPASATALLHGAKRIYARASCCAVLHVETFEWLS
jgi:hypothetical protein